MQDISELYGLFLVNTCKLTKGEDSASGELIVNLVEQGSGITIGGSDGNNVRIEFGLTQIEREIEMHPRYRPGAGGAKEQTAESLAAIERKLEDENSETFEAGSAAEELYTKRRRGQRTYILFAPVVTQRTGSPTKPKTFGGGKIENPPDTPSGTSDYAWLKTDDRIIYPGEIDVWDRVEEWTGAEYWDEETYS